MTSKDIRLGHMFGKWKVIGKLENNKHNKPQWLCECQCEKKTKRPVAASSLVMGVSSSCGCTRGKIVVDLSGKVFGKLTVLKRSEKTNKYKDVYWLCECSCDNKTKIHVRTTDLNKGSTKSCGCRKFEGMFWTHRKTNTRIYKIYKGMIKRCYNEKSSQYAYYGGRGIKVCEEWRHKDNFMNFYSWSMENGYEEHLSIDRIDVNGNYEPSNCRWVTNLEQQNNTRKTVYIEFNGIRKNASEWAKEYDLPTSLILERHRRGIKDERLFLSTNLKSGSQLKHKKE